MSVKFFSIPISTTKGYRSTHCRSTKFAGSRERNLQPLGQSFVGVLNSGTLGSVFWRLYPHVRQYGKHLHRTIQNGPANNKAEYKSCVSELYSNFDATLNLDPNLTLQAWARSDDRVYLCHGLIGGGSSFDRQQRYLLA